MTNKMIKMVGSDGNPKERERVGIQIDPAIARLLRDDLCLHNRLFPGQRPLTSDQFLEKKIKDHLDLGLR